MAEGTEGTAAVAEPAKAPVIEGAKPAAEPTEEYIFDGKPVNLTKAQAKAYVQKGLFADKRIKSAQVLEAKTKPLIEALKTPEGLIQILKDPSLGANPKEVFKKLMSSDVIDDELKEEMSRWVYENVVKTDKMSPEELANRKKLSDYERLKKDEDDRKAKDLTEKQQAEVTRIYQAVRSEVTKQIVADKTFPQVEGAIRSVIDTLRAMNKNGAPVTPENVTKAIAKVKKDFIVYQQSILDAFDDPEKLIEAIGEARALKISKALVARIQAKQKVKPEDKKVEGAATENITERLDKKFGRERHGYTVLDV